MKKLDIDDLYLMRAIKGSASLSAAASKLGISKGAVSKRIKKIEDIIESPLLRASRNLRLSETGEEFLRLSSDVLDMYDAFQERIANIKSGKNLLRIMGNPSIMDSDLPEVLEMFVIQYPNVKIQMLNGLADETYEAVRSGRVDVGIVPDDPGIEGLIFHRYKSERLVVMAPYSHPLTNSSSLRLRDVAKYPIVGATASRSVSTILETAAKRENLKLDYQMEIDDYTLQAGLVARTDIGLAIVFESIARRVGAGRQFNIIPLDEAWAERSIYMCLPNVLKRSKPTDDFVDLMYSRF